MKRFVTSVGLAMTLGHLVVACNTSSEDDGAGGAAGSPSGAGGASAGLGSATAGTASTTAGAGSATAGTGNASAGTSNGNAGAGNAGAGNAGAGNAGGTGSGAGSGGSAGGGAGGGSGTAGTGNTPSTEKFSFFVTSLKAMKEVSGSQDGFGGDLRFGETGDGAGLKGADKICTTIAEKSMPRNGKTWRAFLSASKGADGKPVNAIERIGSGPWYDRTGRLFAKNVTDALTERPTGADPAIINDFPNENGIPNHDPDNTGDVDNHDFLTGTDDKGKLFNTDPAFHCSDWTSKEASGSPRVGHSWPRGGFGGGGPSGGFGGGPGGGAFGSGANWMSSLNEAGCAPGVFIIEMGPPGANGTKTVGDGGGYGGIYCFALTP